MAVDYRGVFCKNYRYPPKHEDMNKESPLSPFKMAFPDEWRDLHQKVHDGVWLGRGEPMTEIPLYLLDPVTKSLKSVDLIEFKNSGKTIMEKLPKWSNHVRKVDSGLGTDVTSSVRAKTKKTVSIIDRNPSLGVDSNTNYYDLRQRQDVKGPNVLYAEKELRPLDDEERKRAGVLLDANQKRIKVPPVPAKTLLEEPFRGSDVEDSWTEQGYTYYGFMIGGRYNRFDTFDELLFREYGILLPRNQPGRVFVADRILEEEEQLKDRNGSATETSSSMLGDRNSGALDDTSSSSGRLRFTMPTTLSNSEPLTSSTSQRGHSGLTYEGGETATVGHSVASSAYYYENNAKSVKALMERLATSMATPKRGYGGNHNQHASNFQANHAPRTVLKGGRGGRTFSFSYRPRPNVPGGAATKPEVKKNNPKIDQLISLGYQLATSTGRGHND